MNRLGIWFGRAMWLGILADWLRGVPAIFAPNWTLGLAGQKVSENPTWVAFAALLLVLLSLFYIPGAGDPYRYPASAWLGVAARLPMVVFFLCLYAGQYAVIGIIDLFLLLVQLPLLILVWRRPAPFGDIPDARIPQTKGQDVFEYDGSTFAEVKGVVFREPYDSLPSHRGLGLANFTQFFNASARNLIDKRDIRPRFDKLIHANGICYSGVWRIDWDSPYTGYFANGAQGLVLARLSVAGSQLTRGHRRAFGIAGKVFPTMDPNAKVKPGNFVTVNNLSGTRDRYITDAVVTNMPTIGFDPAANFVNRVIFRMMDTRPGYRLLHPISTLGLPRGSPIVTPDLLMLKVREGTAKADANDFRDELRLRNYPNHILVYTINVRSFSETKWTRLGTIEFTEDVISEGGDKRLHFWIPQDLPSHN
jgi:hypothetical protein